MYTLYVIANIYELKKKIKPSGVQCTLTLSVYRLPPPFAQKRTRNASDW